MSGTDALRVARFLRGRLEHRTRHDDVYISSYPRSGTTWLQQILCVLACDADRGFRHIDDVVPWFERSLAHGVRTARDLEQMPSPRIFKSHLPAAWLPHRGRRVYVSRDGRDVAVSYYHLYRSHLDYRGDFADFFDRFMDGQLQYGCWFKHVAGFERLRGRSGLYLVEYERMLRELPVVMAELDEFCGFGRGRARVDQLAELCTFEYMKKHEARFDHATEPRAGRGNSSGMFIRRGGSGEGRLTLDAEQQRRFAQRQRPYLPALELNLPAFLR